MDVQRDNKIYLSCTVFLKYFIKLRFYKVLQYWRRCDCKIRFSSITSTSTTLALVNYGISNTSVLGIPELNTKTDNYSLTPKMPHVKIPIFTSPPHGIEAPPHKHWLSSATKCEKGSILLARNRHALPRAAFTAGPGSFKTEGGRRKIVQLQGWVYNIVVI